MLSIPVGTLFILLVLAALAGLIAAQLPARRAAKLDMLQALASEYRGPAGGSPAMDKLAYEMPSGSSAKIDDELLATAWISSRW